MSTTSEGRLQEVLTAVEGDLPSFVRRLVYQVGPDWSGSDSVFVWVIEADDAPADDAHYSEVRQRVRAALERAGIPIWAYVYFRSEAEQLAEEHDGARP